jgi:hypothetical protein
MDPTAMIRANGEAWNAIAPMRHGQPAEFFVNGGSALDPIEVELAGAVRGARVLQLACSTGDEVISWSMLGAVASGIDISQVHIDKPSPRPRLQESSVTSDAETCSPYRRISPTWT